jgi:hypothetical protein
VVVFLVSRGFDVVAMPAQNNLRNIDSVIASNFSFSFALAGF